MAATDLSSLLEAAVTGPQSVSVDGASVSARSVNDLIEADRYLASKAAARLSHRGLRFSRLRPPGAVTHCSSQTGASC